MVPISLLLTEPIACPPKETKSIHRKKTNNLIWSCSSLDGRSLLIALSMLECISISVVLESKALDAPVDFVDDHRKKSDRLGFESGTSYSREDSSQTNHSSNPQWIQAYPPNNILNSLFSFSQIFVDR
jgi:hypothetical protein